MILKGSDFSEKDAEMRTLFNTSFSDLEEKGHSYADRYGKEVWNSVAQTMKQSKVFNALSNLNQKIVAHQVLLDLHYGLEKAKLNAVQRVNFSKLFLLNNQTFFQTKTRGYSTGPHSNLDVREPEEWQGSKEKLGNHENDIWKDLEDVGNIMTDYTSLPDAVKARIKGEDYTNALRIIRQTAGIEKMSANQRKSFAHLLTALSSDLGNSGPNLNISSQQKREIISAFGERVSKYVEHMLREETERKSTRERFLLEGAAQIRWRRNPRTHLNKVVMTCKKGEYKKSLNKELKIAGQKVKEVMCLPASTKPAKEKAKDRKSSIKRWRKIKSNPGKMVRSNLKRKFTKKFSTTIRQGKK